MRTVERIDQKSGTGPIEMFSCIQLPLDENGNFYKNRQTFHAEAYERVVYLGQLEAYSEYGDVFACYSRKGCLTIWRGKLNGGTY